MVHSARSIALLLAPFASDVVLPSEREKPKKESFLFPLGWKLPCSSIVVVGPVPGSIPGSSQLRQKCDVGQKSKFGNF